MSGNGADTITDRIARLEESNKAIGRTLDRLNNTLDRLATEIDNRFVSQKEFWPVKAIVFTGAGIVLVSVLSAAIGLVIIGVT